MNKYLLLLLLPLLFLYHSCRVEPENIDKEPELNCPFEYLETNYTTISLKKGYEHNINALINLGFSKVKIGEIEINLSDSLIISNLMNKTFEKGLKFSPEDVVQHNKIVHAMCIKYTLISKMDSIPKNIELQKLLDNIDKYFNLLPIEDFNKNDTSEKTQENSGVIKKNDIKNFENEVISIKLFLPDIKKEYGIVVDNNDTVLISNADNLSYTIKVSKGNHRIKLIDKKTGTICFVKQTEYTKSIEISNYNCS